MINIKKIMFVCGITCFILASIGYMFYSINENDYLKKGIYDECTDYDDNIETINKQAKVSANTNIILIDKYLLCNHEIDNNIEIDNKNINKTYKEIEEIYKEYSIYEFNNKYIRLKKEINKYCPFHYVLKETENKIGIYNKIDDNNNELITVLDVNISVLREKDRELFLGNGIEVYGKEQLYEFIEDFDS